MAAISCLKIKICGLTDEAAVDTALSAGADMLGFVLFPPSPRHRDPARLAELMAPARGRAELVALAVNPDDATIGTILDRLDPDAIQLHGKELPGRVAEIRARAGRPVIKALGISVAGDLAEIDTYRGVADRLLFDAKPPKDATRPGGLGKPFDWSLLENLDQDLPFMLSGGLTVENVGGAVARIGPPGVDVSSGVESRPGTKDLEKIERFIKAARAADEERQNR